MASFLKPFDRTKLNVKELHERNSLMDVSVMKFAGDPLPEITTKAHEKLEFLAGRVAAAKETGASAIFTYGAHVFRNGNSPLIIALMEKGLITHLATNGAGCIHDWELAHHGRTTEGVEEYLEQGQFGIWQETGLYQNLALGIGAHEGLGYGEALGKMMDEDGLMVPEVSELRKSLAEGTAKHLAGTASLIEQIDRLGLEPGFIEVKHPGKQYSLIWNAYRLKVPLSVCPGIGYDIIYNHPANQSSALGQCAERDFLAFTNAVSDLEGGVYMSVGSAIMSPMILEKALAMARNLALQENRPLKNYHIAVVDMQPGSWDWRQGEPPKTSPAYYLRFCKSFSRMGDDFDYYEMDNRAFVQNLHAKLQVVCNP